MSIPVVTGVAPRWESELATRLGQSHQNHLVRRCADVAELVGVAAAGLARVALVSSDFRGLDRAAVDALHETGTVVVGVHPPGQDDAARTLRRWGVPVVLGADQAGDGLEEAILTALEGSVSPTSPRTPRAPGSPRGPAGPGEPGGPGGPGTPRAPSGANGQDRAGSLDLDAPDPEEEEIDAELRRLVSQADAGGSVRLDVDQEDDGRPPGRVVVVWGPHGSPGRTTVAVNLAAEIADPLTRVVLVDADTYGACVAQTLALLDEAPGVAAACRAADQGSLDRSTLAALAPEVRPGMRVLTGLPRAERWPELRESALADVLEACRAIADYVVVDVAPVVEQDEELSFDTAAPRRNGATLTALEAADRVVVVGTGDPIGLQRLVRALDVVGEHSGAPRDVVVTRVRPGPVGPEPDRRIREALHRFAGAEDVRLVPEDRDAMDAALLQGRALVEVRPASPARLCLRELADLVAGRPSTPARSGGRRWWRRRSPAR